MACSNKKCSPRIMVMFLIVAVGVFWLMWFGTASLLGKKEVEHGLQQLSLQLSEMSAPYGREAKLNYGEITFEGWGYSTKAIVHNVSVEVGSAIDPMKINLNIGNVTVSSDPIDYRRLIMKIPGPLYLGYGSENFASLVFAEPLVYGYRETEVSRMRNLQNDIVLPKEITVMKEQNASTGQPSEQALIINFSANPNIQVVSVPEQRSNTLSYNLSGMNVAGQGKNLFTVGNISNNLSKTAGDEEGRISGKNLFKADDVVFYINDVPTKPYALNFDADFTIDENVEPVSIPEAPAELNPKAPIVDNSTRPSDLMDANAGYNQNREVTINEYIMSTPDFKVTAAGKFANIKKDPLPSGEISVNIENVQQFLSSELVTSLGIKGADGILSSIVGHPIAGENKASFVLKREKGGTFFVGQTTFEQLIASVFSGSMMMPSAPVEERLPNVSMPPSEVAPSYMPQPGSPDDAVISPSVDLPISRPQQ